MASPRLVAIPVLAVVTVALAATALANHTPNPTSVTVAGSLQSEIGCAADWDPGCSISGLTYNSNIDRWVGNFSVPAGSYEYKVAINGAWDESYGAGGVPNGPNIVLSVGTTQNVTFVYDHETHIVTHSLAPIVIAPGSFQTEIGCAGDWMPDCIAAQLFDADLDGVFAYSTTAIPPGYYEFKIALGLSWDINYGAGGVFNGPNAAFEVPVGGARVTIYWNSTTHVPTVVVDATTHTTRSTWGRLKLLYR
jgi:hypothetical protein